MDFFPVIFSQPRKKWTPKMLPNLKLWLRADLGVTLNGSNVSTWADQSGNGNNVTQGTANKQPLYVASDANIRNKPVLDFDGVRHQLQGDYGAALTGAKNWSLIVVYQADTLTGTRSAVSVGAGGNGYDFIINFAGTGKREVVAKGVAEMIDGNATSNYEIWTATRDNQATAVTTLRVNGVAQTLTPSTVVVSAPGVSVSIGANFAVSFLDGKVAEVILCSSDISTTASNITKLHTYLNRRYGIAIS